MDEVLSPEAHSYAVSATVASSVWCLQLGTDEVIYQVAGKRNSETFIALLEHLVQQHSGGRPLVLILDNGSIHPSLASQAAFAVPEDRLLPMFLPRYCSQRNTIE